MGLLITITWGGARAGLAPLDKLGPFGSFAPVWYVAGLWPSIFSLTLLDDFHSRRR